MLVNSVHLHRLNGIACYHQMSHSGVVRYKKQLLLTLLAGSHSTVFLFTRSTCDSSWQQMHYVALPPLQITKTYAALCGKKI